jgi:hypothetical protein
VIRAVLLAKLLKFSGLLSVGVGTSTYLFISVLLIYNGLPKETSLELAAAAAVGAASLMEFIDSLVGISGFLQRRQESVFLINLEKDIALGEKTFSEALQKIIERRFISELKIIPWYNFKSRKTAKTKIENRCWIIENILPYTLCSANKDMPIELLCNHLYEMDEFVTKHRYSLGDSPNSKTHATFYNSSIDKRSDLFEIVRDNSQGLLYLKETRIEIERKMINDRKLI